MSLGQTQIRPRGEPGNSWSGTGWSSRPPSRRVKGELPAPGAGMLGQMVQRRHGHRGELLEGPKTPPQPVLPGKDYYTFALL